MHALSPFTSVQLACLLLLFAIVGPARAAEIDDTVTRLDAQERTAAFIGYQVGSGQAGQVLGFFILHAGHACIPGCPASDWPKPRSILMPSLDLSAVKRMRRLCCPTRGQNWGIGWTF